MTLIESAVKLILAELSTEMFSGDSGPKSEHWSWIGAGEWRI